MRTAVLAAIVAAAGPAQEPQIEESHLLQFERFILMSAEGQLAATDFRIGRERIAQLRGGGEISRVEIGFRRRGEPLALPRAAVQAVVSGAERTGASPWRLLELHMSATDDREAWRVDRLVFARMNPGSEPVPGLPRGIVALEALDAVLAGAAERGVAGRLSQLHLRQRPGRSGSLQVTVELAGPRFRARYAQIEDALAAEASAPDGPFRALEQSADEVIMPDDSGAAYEVTLLLR